MDLLTHNVSRSGIFLRAGLMPKIGKELALECRVPTNREPVRLTAKVVHRTPPSNLLGQVTGFAVEILEGDLEAWVSFLSLIELAEAQLRMESQLQEVDTTEGLKLRRRPRVSRAMRIRLNVGEDQVSAVTEDVSGGGLCANRCAVSCGASHGCGRRSPSDFRQYPLPRGCAMGRFKARKRTGLDWSLLRMISKRRVSGPFYPPVSFRPYHLRSSLDAMTVCFRAISRQFR